MTSAAPIRVFIADDHAIVRRGLLAFLHDQDRFVIVGEASDGRQVLNATELASCDVLILDLSLPVVSGMEVLRRVHAKHPTLAIIVHSMHSEDEFRPRALAAGASAYVSKERPPAALLAAIQHALAHGPEPLVRPATEEPTSRHASLSQREHQVFMLIVSGRTVSEVAAELDLHASTVSNHLARIRAKLGVNTVVELVAYAYAEGLLEHPLAP